MRSSDRCEITDDPHSNPGIGIGRSEIAFSLLSGYELYLLRSSRDMEPLVVPLGQVDPKKGGSEGMLRV